LHANILPILPAFLCRRQHPEQELNFVGRGAGLKRPANSYIVDTLREFAIPGLPEPFPLHWFFTKAQLNLTLQEESRRSAHGEQAGTKYSGHISEHRSQGQNPNYDLSGQRRQAYW
jgi:hypothetical protein